ncbi:MAG: peptidoglycan-binding protein [Planctomycetales bacterium]|nr:peptidoglycan-binding protein [Planctomycetales bacterium]
MTLVSNHFRGNQRLLKALENSPALSKGHSGHAVRLVQQALLDLNYSMPISVKQFGTPDGIFGSETKTAVRNFQRDSKELSTDGVVGHNTLTRIDTMLADRKTRFTGLPALPPGSPGAVGYEPFSPEKPKKDKPVPPPRIPHKIERFLHVNAQTARQLAPAKITPFATHPEWPEEAIRRYLAAAVRVARMTKLTLHTLEAHKNLEALWNSGFEAWWFGEYSDRKFRKVIATFDSIVQHLTSPSLRVICDDEKGGYANANPGIRKITLGKLWMKPVIVNPNGAAATVHDDKAERIQTFIHEAAHIAGRTNGLSESHLYGRTPAHSLAGKGMKSTRSADNYGYYAIDIATEGQHRRLN